MTRIISSLIGAILAAAFISGAAEAETQKAVALISTEPMGDNLLITSQLHAYVDIAATAEVTIKRKARSGVINLVQARSLVLRAGETSDVGTSQISFGPGDDLVVTAIVRSGDAILSENNLVLNQSTTTLPSAGDKN